MDTAENATAEPTSPVVSAPGQMVWVGPIPADSHALLMPLANVVDHTLDSGWVIARVGEGDCPWGCGNHGIAEAGMRGWCPNPLCAGAVLAVLPPKPRTRNSTAPPAGRREAAA